jgi:hypothetical protein
MVSLLAHHSYGHRLRERRVWSMRVLEGRTGAGLARFGVISVALLWGRRMGVVL